MYWNRCIKLQELMQTRIVGEWLKDSLLVVLAKGETISQIWHEICPWTRVFYKDFFRWIRVISFDFIHFIHYFYSIWKGKNAKYAYLNFCCWIIFFLFYTFRLDPIIKMCPNSNHKLNQVLKNWICCREFNSEPHDPSWRLCNHGWDCWMEKHSIFKIMKGKLTRKLQYQPRGSYHRMFPRVLKVYKNVDLFSSYFSLCLNFNYL